MAPTLESNKWFSLKLSMENEEFKISMFSDSNEGNISDKSIVGDRVSAGIILKKIPNLYKPDRIEIGKNLIGCSDGFIFDTEEVNFWANTTSSGVLNLRNPVQKGCAFSNDCVKISSSTNPVEFNALCKHNGECILRESNKTLKDIDVSCKCESPYVGTALTNFICIMFFPNFENIKTRLRGT